MWSGSLSTLEMTSRYIQDIQLRSLDVDLDAYFGRIKYAGPRETTVQVLNDICLCHAMNIPFNNVSCVQGQGVDLSPSVVDDKLIVRARGGYCFEMNSLLFRVLVKLGFTAELVSGRIHLGYRKISQSKLCPRTHAFILVTIDGKRFAADVGVGHLTPTAAISLDTAEEQTTPNELVRIVTTEEKTTEYKLQVSFLSMFSIKNYLNGQQLLSVIFRFVLFCWPTHVRFGMIISKP